MKRFVSYFFSILVFSMLFSACQRDDICSETTQTTPLLNIKFFNIENPGFAKNVNNLNIKAAGQDSSYFKSSVNSASISIPLKTNSQNLTYYFTLNSDTEGVTPNTDTLKFSYVPQDLYTNRACGYRVVFNGFQAFVIQENDNKNWIKNISLKTTNITHEDTTHLYIYH